MINMPKLIAHDGKELLTSGIESDKIPSSVWNHLVAYGYEDLAAEAKGKELLTQALHVLDDGYTERELTSTMFEILM